MRNETPDAINSADHVDDPRDKEGTYRSEWNGEISQTHPCIRKHLVSTVLITESIPNPPGWLNEINKKYQEILK